MALFESPPAPPPLFDPSGMPDLLAHVATLRSQGRLADALQLLFDATASGAASRPALETLLSMLETVVLHTVDARTRTTLVQLCRDETLDVQPIARAVLGVIASTPAFMHLAALAEGPAEPELDAVEPAAEALCADPLVQAVLTRMFVPEPQAERVLRLVRRALLARLSTGDSDAPWQWGAVALMATTAWHGEYAWDAEPDEVAFVEAAADHLEQWMHARCDPAPGTPPGSTAAEPPPSAVLLLYAMYRHLGTLPSWRRLSLVPPAAWEPSLADACRNVVARHAQDRLDEEAAAGALPSFGLSADVVSQRVRTQYEHHPYPRWTTCPVGAQTTVAEFITALTGRQRGPDSTRLLIAGCGTGRQAVHTARSFVDADVTAFDLSLASLGYAVNQTQRLAISSIRYLQGDLLAFDPQALPEPVPDFALISCSGVLHHLADPLAGWRRLLASLHPLGMMKIGLYSTLARTGVQAAREVLASYQLGIDDGAVRQARRILLALPEGHPARTVLDSPDFYSLGGCRDFVMHVQERSYTIPELAAALKALDLRFLGFQLPDTVLAQFRSQFPDPTALRDLAAWDHFERTHPLTFFGMYQFWCAPSGRAA